MICKIIETSENYAHIVIENDAGECISRILCGGVEMTDDQDKPMTLTVVYSGEKVSFAHKEF